MSNEFSTTLTAHVAALETALPESAIDAAQRRLEERLATARRPSIRRPLIGWAAVAATACLVITLAILPVSGGMAFATVQKHLSDFNTLTLVIDQQSQGIALPDIHVRMNREGDVRTDIGTASSTVINMRDHQMLTLLHDSHQAMQMSLPASAVHKPGDNLRWLDTIRQFQGKAEKLPNAKVIDGQKTTGWSFATEGVHIVLWADADGLPRAVEINDGQLLSQHMHVAVDAPIDPTVFSTTTPAGYHLMGSDDE
ncbi:hypothetical protein [Rhodanobacter sp. L36]|uniref:hypothetical protein n=1 Tax=Rhodanobacter sp. L36 TaxID=1747221 RepID=UPI00131B6B27|nr:hypothetical protein [Rhodanobacter sp. L36]